MAVDFEIKRVPKLRVASVTWKGAWKDARIRKEFERVHRWASTQGLRPGRWILTMPSEGKFVVAVEVRGEGKGAGDVRVRTLPAGRVACVCFDPKVIEPRVVYHGLTDWLRWRKKDKTIRSVGNYREVYPGNPWTDAKAWANVEVQAIVR